MFLPTTPQELSRLGWKSLDVILVTGDAYIDSPHVGVAVIGKVLLNAGYRVGIISQPDIHSDLDICRLGVPELFWGVTAGCMDSMIANYTPTRKRRRTDDLTPGGQNTKRPDMAAIVYPNLIRKYFKNTRPIVLGGIEASLRRISHYDYGSDSVRRSILFDAKADILVYGMGEETVLDLARKLLENRPVADTRGICHIASEKPKGYIELPSHEEVARDKNKFEQMFRVFYENSDPFSAVGLCQKQDTRYLIQNPPQLPPSPAALDRIYELDYERDVHPFHKAAGRVRALETIRFSITTHRGCYGECRFCSIPVHQGRIVISRSEASILKEAARMSRHPEFKGIIPDVGGPTANMYGIECGRKGKHGACRNKGCLTPVICNDLPVSHHRQIHLLENLRQLPGIKKVFIGSGIRHDLVLKDEKFGRRYLEELVRHHVSGQLKVAPEHSEEHILHLMGKPGFQDLLEFKRRFDQLNQQLNKKQYLTYYFIAAYPGCTLKDMAQLRRIIRRRLGLRPQQVQIFTPSPATIATLMYYTATDPDTGRPLFVEKNIGRKEAQKKVLVSHGSQVRRTSAERPGRKVRTGEQDS
ncbi:MAG: YgiQ family radical SAM protein [Pseudomonadota bacterium]